MIPLATRQAWAAAIGGAVPEGEDRTPPQQLRIVGAIRYPGTPDYRRRCVYRDGAWRWVSPWPARPTRGEPFRATYGLVATGEIIAAYTFDGESQPYHHPYWYLAAPDGLWPLEPEYSADSIWAFTLSLPGAEGQITIPYPVVTTILGDAT